MRVLFWNLGRIKGPEIAESLIRQERPDIALFCEGPIPWKALLKRLAGVDPRWRSLSNPGSAPRVIAYTTFPEELARPFRDDPRMSHFRVRPPKSKEELLLVGVHLPSPLHRRDPDRQTVAFRQASTIRDGMHRSGLDRALIVGDFNMDPHEAGMICQDGFRALSSRRIAHPESSRRSGPKLAPYYNPSSRLPFTGRRARGTYYRRGAECGPGWHVFDQVIVHPHLVSAFADDRLSVVERIGADSLLTEAGVPDGKRFSDHLPIVFELDSNRDTMENNGESTDVRRGTDGKRN